MTRDGVFQSNSNPGLREEASEEGIRRLHAFFSPSRVTESLRGHCTQQKFFCKNYFRGDLLQIMWVI